MFRMFLPGACLVAKPETDKHRSLAGRRGSAGMGEIDGDRMTIHNLRNCDYRTETDYSNCWSDRTVNLSDLRGADLFFTTWGVPCIGHPIVSFWFGDNQHVAFSIEARYKGGQDYSAILGFFRQYELIFVVADERDVDSSSHQLQKGRRGFPLSHGTLGPESARAIFLTYVRLSKPVERSSRVVQRADAQLHHDS